MANAQRTFTKIIALDNVFSRNSTANQNHWAGTTVKGYRVLSTNDENFQLDIVADPIDGSIQGLPLNDVRLHNYTRIAKSAVFENFVAQPGVWVKILISVEDPLIYTGEKKTSGSFVSLTEGSLNNNAAKNVTTTDSVIIPANSTRKSAYVQHKSGNSLWVGNPVDLQDVNYKNICIEVKPGETFIWRNSGALSAKTDAGTTVVAVMQEL